MLSHTVTNLSTTTDKRIVYSVSLKAERFDSVLYYLQFTGDVTRKMRGIHTSCERQAFSLIGSQKTVSQRVIGFAVKTAICM